MHPGHAVGPDPPELSGDRGAPVSALHAVGPVPEPFHQHPEGPGHPLELPAGLRRGARQREAGNARQHEVEGVGRVAAVRPRVGQRADDPPEFHERPGPAVGHQQHRRVGLRRAHMREVHAGPVDDRGELRPCVQPRFGGPPVVAVAPVRDELPYTLQREAVGPPRSGQFVGPADPREPRTEIVQLALVHIQPEHLQIRVGSIHGPDARCFDPQGC